MFNIWCAQKPDDLLLGCHVLDEEEAEYWAKYYADRYPDKEFYIVTIH